MKFSKILLAENQIWPDGGGGGLPYSNVYIFTDGIFTGTDTSPRTTTIKSMSIWSGWYDRRENTIWLYTSNGVGRYSFDTGNVTIVDSYNPGQTGHQICFYGNYLVIHCDSYVAIIDRVNKTKIRTISRPSGEYTSISIASPYNQSSKHIILGAGYADKIIYDITTGSSTAALGTSYWQVRCINDKIVWTAENVNSGIYIYNTSGTRTKTITSSGNWNIATPMQTDSGLIDKVTSSDLEYSAFCVGCVRDNTNSKIINVDTGTELASPSTGNNSIRGQLIKYNSQYAIGMGSGNYNNNSGTKIWKVDRSTLATTILASNIADGATGRYNNWMNITSSGNICVGGVGIYNFSGTRIYTNSSFITGFSKTVF